MTREPLVSVVIPTHDRAEILCDCIDSVLANDWTNLEVVVSDDASRDGTAERVAARYGSDPRVSLVRSDISRMAAGARNAGIAKAKGDYVLFLDDDNRASRDMIRRLVETFRADPRLGLVGPLSLQLPGETVFTLGSSYNWLTSQPRNLFEGKTVEELPPLPDALPSCYAPNAVMVSRRALEAVKGFDPFYGIQYEEADFGYRILQAGFTGAIAPAARIVHVRPVAAAEAGPLRRLGVTTPARAWVFARNRPVFVRRFFPWWGKLACFLFFVHAANAYYILLALRHRRGDIARAWFRGALRGLWIVATGRHKTPEIFENLEEAERQFAAGETRDALESLASLREKHGLPDSSTNP